MPRDRQILEVILFMLVNREMLTSEDINHAYCLLAELSDIARPKAKAAR